MYEEKSATSRDTHRLLGDGTSRDLRKEATWAEN